MTTLAARDDMADTTTCQGTTKVGRFVYSIKRGVFEIPVLEYGFLRSSGLSHPLDLYYRDIVPIIRYRVEGMALPKARRRIMSYEYAGSLFDTQAERDIEMLYDFIAHQSLEEGLENALESAPEDVFEEMEGVGWVPDEGWCMDFEDVWNAALGKMVWWTRDELDMSQAALGEALGYDHRHIGRLEDGDRPVKPVVLRALLQMLRGDQ